MNVVVQKTAAELNYGLSLPHRKMEDWRWTDLRQLVDKPYPPRQTVVAAPKDVERLLKSSPFAKVAGARIVFVNGHYSAEHSQLKNDNVTSAVKLDEPVITMNAAFATDGARLKISGTTDTPIELLFLATNADAAHHRHPQCD